jgi:hypothetical protein
MRIAPGWVALPVNELPRTGGSQTSSELKLPTSFQTVAAGRSTRTSRETERLPAAKLLAATNREAAPAVWRRIDFMDDFRKLKREKEDLQSAVTGVIGFRRRNPTSAG